MGTQPAGIEGKHWASETISIPEGHKAEVTATNVTINAGQHNTSRIVLTIDGRSVEDTTVEAGRMSVTHNLRDAGEHEIVAECFNEHAEAHTCTITVNRIKVIDV
jgi:hypothetical protein